MWHSPARELRYEGRCDVTVGQGEVFHLLFFFLRLWQNGNMPSADPFLLRLHTPPHPQLSPCSDLSHILTHTHTLRPPLSEKDKADCQEVLWPFPK